MYREEDVTKSWWNDRVKRCKFIARHHVFSSSIAIIIIRNCIESTSAALPTKNRCQSKAGERKAFHLSVRTWMLILCDDHYYSPFVYIYVVIFMNLPVISTAEMSLTLHVLLHHSSSQTNRWEVNKRTPQKSDREQQRDCKLIISKSAVNGNVCKWSSGLKSSSFKCKRNNRDW